MNVEVPRPKFDLVDWINVHIPPLGFIIGVVGLIINNLQEDP